MAMKKLEWKRKGGVGNQRTTNLLYWICRGLNTKYLLYILTYEDEKSQYYEKLKGGDSITELKKFAQQHYNFQKNVYKL